MKFCLECNKEIKSHGNAIRHKACFIKFKAFDKKEWTRKWREANRDKVNAYARAFAIRTNNKRCNSSKKDMTMEEFMERKVCN